jgi:hypothetical protein
MAQIAMRGTGRPAEAACQLHRFSAHPLLFHGKGARLSGFDTLAPDLAGKRSKSL